MRKKALCTISRSSTPEISIKLESWKFLVEITILVMRNVEVGPAGSKTGELIYDDPVIQCVTGRGEESPGSY